MQINISLYYTASSKRVDNPEAGKTDSMRHLRLASNLNAGTLDSEILSIELDSLGWLADCQARGVNQHEIGISWPLRSIVQRRVLCSNRASVLHYQMKVQSAQNMDHNSFPPPP
jgi:hypothetical protein